VWAGGGNPIAREAVLGLSSGAGTVVASLGAVAVVALAAFAWWWTRPLRSASVEGRKEDPPPRFDDPV